MLVGETIGPFLVERELGSGAMGSVFRARFSKDGKVYPVALKIVALGLLGNEGAMARFDREANILKQLKHPHIVRLIATGKYRGTPFIAMEYVDGEPLDRTLNRRNRISWEEVARLGRQLCEALQYAHERGIIHRDLKPSNLMVNKDGVLKLTDFGIAKDTDVTALTGANSTIGTAAYMSPEQCRGEKNLTNKSDLYSLGVVFFELLTGKKPFTADTTVDMFLKHVNDKAPPASRFVADLPGKFDLLIRQLLEKDKDNRPIDAAWVARFLSEMEDDVQNRKSAGLEAANARRIDRPKGAADLDDEDRAAARAMKAVGSSKKKKLKKKSDEYVPLTQQPWFKAGLLGLGLLAVLGLGVYFMMPTSAAKLYAAVEAAEKGKDPDSLKAAVEKYLSSYGTRTDEQTEKVRAMHRDILVKGREAQLAKRFRNNLGKPDEGDDPDAYRDAWLAMEAEKAGDLNRAAQLWAAVRGRFPDATEPPKALWTWVGAKRVKDLQEVDNLAVSLRKEISDNRLIELTPVYEASNPKGLAVRALRLEAFGDVDYKDAAKAARVWESLSKETDNEPDQRPWYLLAARQRALLPKELKEGEAAQKRLAVVQRKAAEAAKKAADARTEAEKRDARNQLRDVIDLYADEDDATVKAAVAQSRKLLETLPKTG